MLEPLEPAVAFDRQIDRALAPAWTWNLNNFQIQYYD
jgi:hypothetical protein